MFFKKRSKLKTIFKHVSNESGSPFLELDFQLSEDSILYPEKDCDKNIYASDMVQNRRYWIQPYNGLRDYSRPW